MLKKLLIIMSCLLLFGGQVAPVRAEEEDIISYAKSLGYDVSSEDRPAAFLVADATTGNILWGDNIDTIRDPASMTKLMAVYLIYEAMARGEFDENTTIKATEDDQATSQLYEISNNKIVKGVSYPVGELLTAALVKSSNVAVRMMANKVSGGNDSYFVDLMNLKAKSLGMTNTKFYTEAGAVARAYDGHYQPDRYDMTALNETTARDLAILTYHLWKDFPQVFDHTDDYTVKIMAGTRYEEEFESYNESLPGGEFAFDGVNGLKTGSSPSAQFNSVVTAERDSQKVITVVMGVGEWYEGDSQHHRPQFTNTLLDYGFKTIGADGNTEQSQSYETVKTTVTSSTVKRQQAKGNWYQLNQALDRTPWLWLGMSLLGLISFIYFLYREVFPPKK